MQVKEDHINLGNVSLAYYATQQGTLNISLTKKIVDWMGKQERNADGRLFAVRALRLQPTKLWREQGMICFQFLCTRDLKAGYSVLPQRQHNFPYRVICTHKGQFMGDIPNFGRIHTQALGFQEPDGMKRLVIAVLEKDLVPVRPQKKRGKIKVDDEVLVDNALQIIDRGPLPETDATVSILKRALNDLVDKLDLELSVNEEGYLEIIRYTPKKL